ncbi:MAG: VOC family protein [Woeseia sp.]
MKIKLNSVIVRDQADALRFYTDILGFEKKMDLPAGKFRWLTVVSPEEPDAAQLLLEPNAHSASENYQRALFDAGIPLTSFAVDDVDAEYERLEGRGVTFTATPANAGGTKTAVFDDTCGNLIQIYEAH